MAVDMDNGAAIPGLLIQITSFHELINQEQLSETLNQLLIGGGKQKASTQASASDASSAKRASSVNPFPFVFSYGEGSSSGSIPKFDLPLHQGLAENPDSRPQSEYSKALLQRSELKLQLLETFDDLLRRYVSILERYRPPIPGAPYTPPTAPYEDYEMLDQILDDLGAINDLLTQFKPEARGLIYIYSTSKIRWIKPLYRKIIMRWAAGHAPGYASSIDTFTSSASSIKVNEAEDYEMYPPASLMMEQAGQISSDMWLSGQREWREYVVRKMIRKASKVLLETVLFIADEDVDILPPGRYGQHDKGFQNLKAAVLEDHRAFFGLNAKSDGVELESKVEEEPEEQTGDEAPDESEDCGSQEGIL